MRAVAALRAVKVRAPAKINLHLAVGATRPDGFHQLATLYQAVDLYDTVHARRDGSGAVTVTVADAAGDPVPGVPSDGSNLCVRAALLLRAHTGLTTTGVALHVLKRIPVAGGLAGGSADAAATLLACDALWRTGLDLEALLGLARRLGSDVPFALVGGTCTGTGRGELVTAQPAGPRLTWVAATSSRGLSTPRCYAELDRLRGRERARVAELPTALLDALRGDGAGLVDALLATARNDLTPAAMALRPGLGELVRAGAQAGARLAMLAGSGPTVLFLGADRSHASRLAAQLLGRFDVDGVHLLTGPVPGAQRIG